MFLLCNISKGRPRQGCWSILSILASGFRRWGKTEAANRSSIQAPAALRPQREALSREEVSDSCDICMYHVPSHSQLCWQHSLLPWRVHLNGLLNRKLVGQLWSVDSAPQGMLFLLTLAVCALLARTIPPFSPTGKKLCFHLYQVLWLALPPSPHRPQKSGNRFCSHF